MTKIISGKGSNGYLYLGNEKGANDIALLTSNKITAILTVASEISKIWLNQNLNLNMEDRLCT
jgi:hypothetical protein